MQKLLVIGVVQRMLGKVCSFERLDLCAMSDRNATQPDETARTARTQPVTAWPDEQRHYLVCDCVRYDSLDGESPPVRHASASPTSLILAVAPDVKITSQS